MFETPTIKSIHEYSEALKIERRTARWLGRPLRKRCVDISLELMFTRILTNASHLVSMANYRKIFWTHSSSQAEQVNGDHFANCLRVMGHLPVWEAPSIFKSPNKHSPDFRELQLLTDFRLGPATFQRVIRCEIRTVGPYPLKLRSALRYGVIKIDASEFCGVIIDCDKRSASSARVLSAN